MKKHFKDILKYNEWANYRVLKTLEEHASEDQELLKTFSHILSAQIIWLNRIKSLPTSPFPIWETYKINELSSMTEETSDNWNHYVFDHKFDTFEEMIFYKDSNDKKHESTIREIISHVVNHSSYHRGQIAMKLREKGIDPPATDFIVYTRSK